LEPGESATLEVVPQVKAGALEVVGAKIQSTLPAGPPDTAPAQQEEKQEVVKDRVQKVTHTFKNGEASLEASEPVRWHLLDNNGKPVQFGKTASMPKGYMAHDGNGMAKQIVHVPKKAAVAQTSSGTGARTSNTVSGVSKAQQNANLKKCGNFYQCR